MDNDVMFFGGALLLGLIVGAAAALSFADHDRPLVTTPAQAWVQYVEVKHEHERVYLEGLK